MRPTVDHQKGKSLNTQHLTIRNISTKILGILSNLTRPLPFLTIITCGSLVQDLLVQHVYPFWCSLQNIEESLNTFPSPSLYSKHTRIFAHRERKGKFKSSIVASPVPGLSLRSPGWTRPVELEPWTQPPTLAA